MLTIIISIAKSEGQIMRVITDQTEDDLSILQYADTILFMDHNIDKARNMKLLLSAFEQLLDLKIIFHKSEIFCFGKAKDHELKYEQLFRYKKGT
jgi:hypothetical protein